VVPSRPMADQPPPDDSNLADGEQHISDLATELGVDLSEHDHAALSQLAQLLLERSLEGKPRPLTLEQLRLARERGGK
jgi:hypothetical protein